MIPMNEKAPQFDRSGRPINPENQPLGGQQTPQQNGVAPVQPPTGAK